jgi:hypothetical protein
MEARLNELFDGEYAVIPAHMREAILAYVERGRLMGDFLRAVVSNDLSGAVGRADAQNLPLLPVYVRWFYNRAPAGCHGSPDAVKAWIEEGGLESAA